MGRFASPQIPASTHSPSAIVILAPLCSRPRPWMRLCASLSVSQSVVRQSASPPVRQSASPPVRQSVSPSVSPSVSRLDVAAPGLGRARYLANAKLSSWLALLGCRHPCASGRCSTSTSVLYARPGASAGRDMPNASCHVTVDIQRLNGTWYMWTCLLPAPASLVRRPASDAVGGAQPLMGWP